MEQNIEYLYDRKKKQKEKAKQIEKDALEKKAMKKNKDLYQNAPKVDLTME